MLTEAKTTLGRESRVSPAQPGLSSLFLLLCRFNKAPKKCQAPCQAPGNGSQVGHKTVTDCDTHTLWWKLSQSIWGTASAVTPTAGGSAGTSL